MISLLFVAVNSALLGSDNALCGLPWSGIQYSIIVADPHNCNCMYHLSLLCVHLFHPHILCWSCTVVLAPLVVVPGCMSGAVE